MKKYIALNLLLLSFIVLLPSCSGGVSQDRYDKVNGDLAKAQAQIQSLQSDLKTTNTTIEKVKLLADIVDSLLPAYSNPAGLNYEELKRIQVQWADSVNQIGDSVLSDKYSLLLNASNASLYEAHEDFLLYVFKLESQLLPSKVTNATSVPTSSNAKPGSIVLVMNNSPYSSTDIFNFKLSYGPLVGYPTGVQLRSGQLFDSDFVLPPGNYSVNEIVPTGWTLDGLVINDPGGDSFLNDSLATIVLAEGETVIVTFSNKVSRAGRIILVVQTTPDTISDEFGFTLTYGTLIGYNNGVRLRNGQLLDSGFTLPASRQYTITELVPQGWQVTKIDLAVGSISGGPNVSSMTTVPPPLGNVATVGLGEGETVVVTFRNTRVSTPTATPTPTQTTTPTSTQSTTTTTTVITTAAVVPKLPASHAGQTACLVCHATGLAGAPIPKVPLHTGFADSQCLACHKAFI